MANNIVNNYSSTIVEIFQSVIKNYEMNVDIIKQCEAELNDLNHEAELSEPKDMYKGYLVYKAIRETRIRRRTAKEENELLKDIYDYFNSSKGKHLKAKSSLFRVTLQNFVQLKKQELIRLGRERILPLLKNILLQISHLKKCLKILKKQRYLLKMGN